MAWNPFSAGTYTKQWKFFHLIRIRTYIMQVYGNVATEPTRKEAKTSQKGYYEFRLAESQRGPDKSPTWYTVRIMKDEDPGLAKGDFVKRSEEHTSELQSLMRISYAVFCLKKKKYSMRTKN